MLMNIVKNVRTGCNCISRQYSITTSCEIRTLDPQFPTKYVKPRQAWLENLDTIECKKLGIVELHPEIFAQNPRIDIIHENVQWQKMYRFVSFAHTKFEWKFVEAAESPGLKKGWVVQDMDQFGVLCSEVVA